MSLDVSRGELTALGSQLGLFTDFQALCGDADMTQNGPTLGNAGSFPASLFSPSFH